MVQSASRLNRYVHLRAGGECHLSILLCENINIDGVTIVSPKDSLNTDGIDPESCKRVRIANCYISTGDDCIILNSGYKYVEGKTLVPTQDVTITNCVFGFGQCGAGFGSETAGGVRDVTISNCVCDGTRRGLYFKTERVNNRWHKPQRNRGELCDGQETAVI